MQTMFEDIRAFHEKFGLEYNGKPRMLPEELSDFRFKFLQEEMEEYAVNEVQGQNELGQFNDGGSVELALDGMLDALVDLVYVAMGTAYMHGFDFEEAWKRVHEANMAKVRAEKPDDSKRGSTYDVVKPEGWTPPSHLDLVKDHAHVPDESMR